MKGMLNLGIYSMLAGALFAEGMARPTYESGPEPIPESKKFRLRHESRGPVVDTTAESKRAKRRRLARGRV